MRTRGGAVAAAVLAAVAAGVLAGDGVAEAPPGDLPDLWADAPPHVFRHRAPGARSVSVAGSFNNWSATHTPMTDSDGDGVWEATVPLSDGEYTYKFVVDGTWVADPTNPRRVPDGYGGENSVVRIGGAAAPDVESRRGDGAFEAHSIAHARDARYVTRPAPGRVVLTLRLDRDDVESVAAVVDGREVPLAPVMRDSRFEWWRGEVAAAETVSYVFLLRDGGREVRLDRHGLQEAPRAVRQPFEIDPPLFQTPAWAREAVFYQIFPERFANGDPSNDPPGARPWRTEPLPKGPEGWFAFYGGDLDGVAARTEYLRDLGVTAVYFNPIFEAESNHKYNTSDYTRVDPHLGGDTAFEKVRAAFSSAGVRIVLDGVFNHSGDHHPFFRDVARRGRESPHWDWYRIRRWPFPAAFSEADPPRNYYDCWWGFGGLPEWNTQNPDLRAYLFGAIERWTPRIDGWRLDVPNEVEHDFWREFRRRVRRANPDAYIVGEIWEMAQEWLGGDQFDAVMNYPFREAATDFFARGSIDAAAFADRVVALLAAYAPQVTEVQYNLLSAHDSTERFMTAAGGDEGRVRQAVAFQFAFPGAPAIYYGEEIGMEGGGDPDNRRVFPWNEPERWHRGLLEFYRKMITLRREHPALRSPVFWPLLADGRTFAVARLAPNERIVAVFHASDAPAGRTEVVLDPILGLPDGSWRDLLTGVALEARGGRLVFPSLAPRAVAFLAPA